MSSILKGLTESYVGRGEEDQQNAMDTRHGSDLSSERNTGLNEPDELPTTPAETRNGVYEYNVPAGQEKLAQDLGLQYHKGHWVSRIPFQRADFQFGRPQFHEIPSQGVAEGSTEQEYGPEWDEKVKRLGQMAKQGERKTVWDPVKRVYKTVPVQQSGIKEGLSELDENLKQWFKEKWVRFGPDGKIRGDCARGDDSEGKPKCLPQSKAHSLGKKGRASAAARKRREDPNPERSGKAINVNTKKKTNEGEVEGSSTTWEVSYDYGPHMSKTVTVKASSEDEARAKVEKAAEKKGMSIMINSVEQGVAEGSDKYGFHTSVSKGKFLSSKYGQDENNLYLHDLMNVSGDGSGPQLVTIDDKRIATELAAMYGGYVERTGMGTYRVYKPRGQTQTSRAPELTGVAEGLSKRDQQDVAAIRAAIARLESQLNHPNADKAAIQQSIAHEKKRLALYGQVVAEGLGLYGPFTVTINTGERPQSRTKTKKFRREDDAILWAQDWLEDAPQYVFATAEVTDPEGNVVWTTDEQGVAEGLSDIVKGVKRKVAGKADPKEVEHMYGRIARSAIKHKTPDQAEKDIERYKRVAKVVNKEGALNEFAPGNGDDGLPYAEYVVYQCDPNDQFEFIGGPLYQTDNLGMAHKYAYEHYLRYRPKAFVVYQPHKEASRGNYGVKGESDEEVSEGLSDTQEKIVDTINKLEDRLKHAKTPEQWDNIKNRIERLQAGLKRSQQGVAEEQLDELSCWSGYTRVQGVPAGAPGSCKKKTNEEQELEEKWSQKYKSSIDCSNPKGFSQKAHCAGKNKNEDVQEEHEQCPECGGPMFSDLLLAEKQDACYNKVKSRYKVWPSAYASGALVQCRKKGAANWGNGGKKNESIEEDANTVTVEQVVNLLTKLNPEQKKQLADEIKQDLNK